MKKGWKNFQPFFVREISAELAWLNLCISKIYIFTAAKKCKIGVK
jgi:hypothetical protein